MHERARTGRVWRSLVALVVALGLVAVAAPAPVSAQVAPTGPIDCEQFPDDAPDRPEECKGEQPPPPPPGEQPPPSSPTPQQPPPGSGQPPPPPPPSGEPTDDSGKEDVPSDQVVVPPADPSLPPDPTAPILQQVAKITLAELRKALMGAQQSRDQALKQVDIYSAQVSSLEGRLGQLQGEQEAAVARLQAAKQTLRKRAVASYVGTPAAQINQILDAVDFNDLSRRFELLGSVVRADRARVTEYDAAKKAVSEELSELVIRLDEARGNLALSQTFLEGADSTFIARNVQFSAAKAGGDLVAAGFVFPIGGPHNYSDTFGAPRMFGTSYAHLHEGTDIFAASGTPLLAVERGVLIKVGTDTLGGTKLWLVGASGTRYYYAHLSAFAEGVVEGKVVQAGDVVGYVGNTGNALTTPAHLHFEVHPGGGPAVNPYPLLRIVDEAQARLIAAAAKQPRRP